MSFFQDVPLAPPDPILGLTAAFNNDSRLTKVNLGVGLYKGEDLSCSVMACVKEAEHALIQFEKNKEYAPIDGDDHYLAKIGELVFGAEFWGREYERICSAQAVGGTGALRIGAAFIKQEIPAVVYISHPTWPNHAGVFRGVGLQVENYPYYDIGRHRLQFELMKEYLNALPEKSVVLLHASCHNPTGVDLSVSEWNELAEIFQRKGLLPFFDCAYQGFGISLSEDVRAIRTFAAKGMELFVAYSNSKNFSLYGERIGALFIVTPSNEIRQKVSSRLKQIIRVDYSNPPIHGSRIVAHVLSDVLLRGVWEQELHAMRQRIQTMRHQLVQRLTSQKSSFDFSYLSECKGMFCYSGLKKEHVERMRAEFGIYMTTDGRINVCGLNRANLDLVSHAILAVMQ